MKKEFYLRPEAPLHRDMVREGQFRWDPLDYEDEFKYADGSAPDFATAIAMAKSDRTEYVKRFKNTYPQFEVRMWSLSGQLRQYKSFGVPDGRVRTVYYVTIRRKES